MMTTVIRAYFPGKDFDYHTLDGIQDPTWRMKLPLVIFTIAIVALGVYSVPLIHFFESIAEGRL